MRRSERKRTGLGRSRSARQPSLYSRTDEIHEKKGTNWVYPLLFCVFLAAAIYFIFFSPYFRVKTVIYGETKYVSREELNKVTEQSRGILNNNIITFGFFNFRGRIGEVIGVKSFQIIRKWPNEIDINIVEKSPTFVWEILNHKYLIDENGYAWADYQDKYVSLPVIVDTKNIPVQLGDKVVPASFVQFASDLFVNFDNTTGFKIAKIEVLDIISDLKVTTAAGWYVFFDTSRTAKNELTSLVRVLEEVRTKKKNLEYVDLRIDNRIFYK